MNGKNKDKTRRNSGSPLLFKILFRLFLIVSIVMLLSYSYRSVSLTLTKLQVFEYAESEVEELRVKNIQLLIREEAVLSDDHVEIQARDRSNLSRQGELVFVIPENKLNSRVVDDYVYYMRSGEERIYVENADKGLSPSEIRSLWMEFFKLDF